MLLYVFNRRGHESNMAVPCSALIVLCVAMVPANCQATARCGRNLDHRTRPNPISAVEDARAPSVNAMIASIAL